MRATHLFAALALLLPVVGCASRCGSPPCDARASSEFVIGCGRKAELPPVEPNARYATAAAVVDDTVYVVGGMERGTTRDTTVASVEAYHPATRDWTRCAPLTTPRAFAAAAAFDGRLYVFGGLDRAGRALDSVEFYDPEKDVWAAAPSLGDARSRLAAVNQRDRSILVAGGLGADERNSAKVRVFFPRENLWRERQSLPSPRHGFALVDAGDDSERAFAIGGYDENGPLDRTEMFGGGLIRALGPDASPRSSGAASTISRTEKSTPIHPDDEGHEWWPKPPLAQARGFFGLARIGMRIYAVGGRCPTNPATEILDLRAIDSGWKRAAPLPKDLCRFSMVSWNGHLLVFGGETEGGMTVNADVLEYDPTSDGWTVR